MSVFSRAAAAVPPPSGERLVSRLSPSVSHFWRKGFASSSTSPPPSTAVPLSDRLLLPPAGRQRPPPCCGPRAAYSHGAGGRGALSSLSFFSERRGGTTTRSARSMSSYEWKRMSKQAQEANKAFSELTKEEIRKAGEEEIDKVEKALKAMEPYNDVFEVRREGLEVFVELGPELGSYWIKFDLSMYQICLLSPRSGPHRYIFDKGSGRWIGEADKHDFQGMLTRDIIQSACGIPDF